MENHQETALSVRSVLVEDSAGCLQVILDKEAMLDLVSLQTLTGRECWAVPQEQLPAVAKRYRFRMMDEAPGCFYLPTLIDDSVGERATLAFSVLDDGEAGTELVPLATLVSALREHRYRVQHGEVSIPARRLRHEVPEPGADEQQISDSLRRFTALRIRQRLEETLELPPLPATAERIIRMRANPNASTLELSRIVESDPSLAAQVVSWAASPYYAAPRKITSVQDAIVRVLGFDVVSNMAVGLILARTVAVPRERVYGDTPYWLQAVYCSTAVDALIRLLPPRQRPGQGLAYLSGLLHNFGYLVLAHTFPPHFARICRYAEANPAISHVAIDHHLVGVSREQISAWLMQCWNMPEELSTALRRQHDPHYDGPHHVYAHLVYIALRLLRSHGIGDAPPETVPQSLYDRYALDPEKVEAAVTRVAESPDIPRMAQQISG